MLSTHPTLSPLQLAIPVLFLALCLSFWGWMFRDMLANDELPTGVRENWTFAFILLNVFAAAIYYNVWYRNRR